MTVRFLKTPLKQKDQTVSASLHSFDMLFNTALSFTIDRAKWVIHWQFALFESLRAPYISACE